MRLRLSVKRHALPLSNVLWSTPSSTSSQAYTIARLLEDVNQILPLESEDWGLEDYVVEVAGFECLHFSAISETLKDNDQVSIRPLLTAEVRSRTLTGRYQISDGGQHLVDGIAYGRPFLRNPSRPAITIPPRKCPRLIDDNAEEDVEAGHAKLITANGEPSHHVGTNGILAGKDSGPPRKKHRPSVHFEIPSTNTLEEEDEDEEEDGDFMPGGDMDESDGTSAGSSDSSDVSSTDTDSDSSDSSESESSSEDSSGPEVVKAPPKRQKSAPFKGASFTRARNKRRTNTKRLANLKRRKILPADANLHDLQSYDEGTSEINAKTPTRAADSTNAGELIGPPRPPITTDLAEPSGDQEPSAPRSTLKRSNEADLAAPVAHNVGDENVASPSPYSLAKRRLRPDVSAISRILSHQTSAAKRPAKKAPAPAEEVEAPTDPNLWKSKINLSAFECWHEEIELSTPAFPFKQHWDSASKLMRKNANGKPKKKKKRLTHPEPANGRDHQNDDEEMPQFDYEAALRNEKMDAEAAAVEKQILGESIPALPEDVASLPPLTQMDIKVGAIIVFKLFMMNPKNMNPEISSFRTAVVVEEGDSGNGTGEIGLRLAVRDRARKEKKYNKNGERIYDRADGFQLENEDEEDDGMDYRHFGELLEPYLLKEG